MCTNGGERARFVADDLREVNACVARRLVDEPDNGGEALALAARTAVEGGLGRLLWGAIADMEAARSGVTLRAGVLLPLYMRSNLFVSPICLRRLSYLQDTSQTNCSFRGTHVYMLRNNQKYEMATRREVGQLTS